MSLYKSQGIVLRVIKYNEADKIVHLLSPDGPISAIAKGSRKAKSRYSGTIEAFCLVNLVLYEGKNLHTITQANLIKPHKKIRMNYRKYLIASAAVEIVDKVTFSGQNEENLFTVLASYLNYVNDNDEISPLALIWLDWQVVKILGLLPILTGNRRPLAHRSLGVVGSRVSEYWFNLQEGLVTDKSGDEGDLIKVEPSTIELLGSIINCNNIEELSAQKPEKININRLTNITEKFINYQLQINLKSRSYIE